MKEATASRPLLLVAAGLALLAPGARAKTVVVTDVQNKKISLSSLERYFIVRLAAKPGTGREWHVVYDPQVMLHLTGGGNFISLRRPHTISVTSVNEEFRSTVPCSRSNSLDGAWLRFLYLSPHESSIGRAQVWAIQYTMKAAK